MKQRTSPTSPRPDPARPVSASPTSKVLISPTTEPTAQARGRKIGQGVQVIYEDADVIVIEKPAGLVTADPAQAANAPKGMRKSARPGETAFDAVKLHVRGSVVHARRRKRGEEDERPGRVWIIHRLDKEASGLLVFAKSERAFAALKEDFRRKSVHRIYTAVTEGVVGPPGTSGTQRSQIDEDRGPMRDRGEERESPLAITHYRVLQSGRDRTLIQAELETGRKNQIRIHMREIGHPLIGDRRFGAKTDPIGRLALHASELGFKHPATQKQMSFTSPPPLSFAKTVGGSSTPERSPPGSAQTSVPVAHRGDDHGDRVPPPAARADTSWNGVAEWYDTLLENKGNDHYEQVILPGAMALLGARSGMRVLDVACGQGILCRRLEALGANVTGIDAAPRLIEAARARSPEITYLVADARSFGALGLSGFDAASCVMALSNFDPLAPALATIAKALRPGGVFVAVITHPAFRAPGQSHWGWDDKSKRQYRRIDAYLSPFAREIAMHPGRAAAGHQGGEQTTPTFHRPVGAYITALREAGFALTHMEEWPSLRAADSGPRAPEENRARLEIPLFLGLRAVKLG